MKVWIVCDISHDPGSYCGGSHWVFDSEEKAKEAITELTRREPDNTYYIQDAEINDTSP